MVETGSFSKAAQEFATTQPTVTKMVLATEARLKVRLLNRNTRGVSVTESGALFFEKCKSITREAEEAENIAKLRQNQTQGLLCIGTSVAFGRRVVVPLALGFMAQHPQIQLDLGFEDRSTDLVAQGIDVAIRMGKLADSLASGNVVEVLKDHVLPEQEIHAVFPSPELVPGKVSAFVAYLQGHFGVRWWETLPKA